MYDIPGEEYYVRKWIKRSRIRKGGNRILNDPPFPLVFIKSFLLEVGKTCKANDTCLLLYDKRDFTDVNRVPNQLTCS